MIEAENKIVMFFYILGFANLTLENKLDIEAIKDNEGPLNKQFNRMLIDSSTPNKLTKVFSSFHSTLEGRLMLARLQCHFTSITFSDSAFIVTQNLNDAVSIINNLMCGLLRNGVPVRAGIASGTFEAIRFKSDIMSDSGEHASHFLGTGVVQACQAESCGINGMRILVHPSIEQLYAKMSTNNLLLQDCDYSEIKNSIGVKKGN